jgi:hypothetical protein
MARRQLNVFRYFGGGWRSCASALRISSPSRDPSLALRPPIEAGSGRRTIRRGGKTLPRREMLELRPSLSLLRMRTRILQFVRSSLAAPGSYNRGGSQGADSRAPDRSKLFPMAQEPVQRRQLQQNFWMPEARVARTEGNKEQ